MPEVFARGDEVSGQSGAGEYQAHLSARHRTTPTARRFIPRANTHTPASTFISTAATNKAAMRRSVTRLAGLKGLREYSHVYRCPKEDEEDRDQEFATGLMRF